ncbi:MAG: DUF58 domain-containing protein [bacterium]|nr:DUF58 domain-containing protein [bacterium]
MMNQTIFDPAVLSSISNLEVVARQAAEGAVAGLHHSHLMGRNVEFSQHRPYNPGDELRHIDWRVYAKTDRFHIKQFEEDTNLRALILVDLSGSMWFGEPSKALYAQQLAAALSYLMLQQGDSAGVCLFDAGVQHYLPPRNRREQWSNILETLSQGRPGAASSDIPSALEQVHEHLKKRGLLIIISDLIDDPVRVLAQLTMLGRIKQEILLFHVLTPEEIELPYRGTIDFHGLEGETDELRVSPKRMRETYRRKVHDFIEAYRAGCLERGVDYQLANTGEPLALMLREYLQRRMGGRA